MRSNQRPSPPAFRAGVRLTLAGTIGLLVARPAASPAAPPATAATVPAVPATGQTTTTTATTGAAARPEGERAMPDLSRVTIPPAPPLGQYPEQARLHQVQVTRAGGVAKVRALLDELDRSPPDSFYAAWQMAFDPAHIDPAAALPILESKLRDRAAKPFVRAKLCLIVGALGTESAAELLVWVLEHDDDADVAAMAIAGLDKCRPVPRVLTVLEPFTRDKRTSALLYGWGVGSIAERAKIVRRHAAAQLEGGDKAP